MATSQADNKILTEVGPGTPMGDLMRRYWFPALRADELPAPDCPPVRVQLLGEKLVAFRDSEDRIGLIDEFCAHRASPPGLGAMSNAGCAALITAGNTT